MYPDRSCFLLWLLLTLAGVPCAAQESMELIPLKWADAEVLAPILNDEPPPPPEELRQYRQQWVNEFAGRVARALPKDLSDFRPQ